MNDWNEITPAQLEMVRSCGPGEVCFRIGDDFIKTTAKQLEASLEAAFRAAWAAAEENARGHLGKVDGYDVDDLDYGTTFLRVTLRDDMGREASGIGMIPKPGAVH